MLVVREKDKDRPGVRQAGEHLSQPGREQFIETKFKGAVVAALVSQGSPLRSKDGRASGRFAGGGGRVALAGGACEPLALCGGDALP